jgi:predicted P-loop ATPase/GTPase
VLIPFFRRNIKAKKITGNQSPDNKAEPQAELRSTGVDEIRKAHQLAEEKKQDKTRATAILYTQTIFAPFILDQDLNRLCHYIDLYSERKELDQITPIKVSDQINTTDVYHFGWNIWNHFRISDQNGMAIFLKKVFAPTLKEVSDIETIKKKLRIQDQHCTIKLNSNLFKQE